MDLRFWRRWRRRAELALEPPAALPARASEDAVARPAPIFDRWAVHQGRGLTPRRIVSLYAEAEAGAPAGQCDLFEDVVEKDGHLRSQLEGRLLAVAGKPYLVQAGGDGENDDRAARLFGDALAQISNVRAMLEHQLQALWFGYSATEIDWALRDGVVAPVWFRNVPHRRIVFDERGDGAPRLLTAESSREGVPLAPGKWLWRGLGRQPARAGLLRTAVWWSHFKTLAVRDWMVFSERYGLPYVTGKYDETASPEDKAVLAEAVQAIGKDGAAIFSRAMEIVIESVEHGGKATDVQGALTELCNREISKLVAGATLTAETQGPGSFALGRVHQSARFDLILADSNALEERIEHDLGRTFVAFNGLNARPPRLKIHVAPEIEPLARMQIYSIAANELGMELDGEQLRQEFQIKRPVGGERLRGSKNLPTSGTEQDPPSGS